MATSATAVAPSASASVVLQSSSVTRPFLVAWSNLSDSSASFDLSAAGVASIGAVFFLGHAFDKCHVAAAHQQRGRRPSTIIRMLLP